MEIVNVSDVLKNEKSFPIVLVNQDLISARNNVIRALKKIFVMSLKIHKNICGKICVIPVRAKIIVNITKNIGRNMRELALFAGAGGGILGSYLLGWQVMAAVEIEPYPRNVLLQRQRDGILPRFPIWDDIKTFDGRPWKGRVGIITGGFPCQDISIAGKGKGITGSRSGLWKEMRRVVCEVGPRFVFVENVPALLNRGMGIVLGDLAEMGYDARWCVLGADDAGAPHIRKRTWILAYPSGKSGKKQKKTGWKKGDRVRDKSQDVSNSNGQRLKKGDIKKKIGSQARGAGFIGSGIDWWNIDPADLPDTNQQYDDVGGFCTGGISQYEKTGIQNGEIPDSAGPRFQDRSEEKIEEEGETEELERLLCDPEDWPVESRVGRVAHGISRRVDRLKTVGNGQVPAVAAIAFIILSEGLI